MTCRVPLPRLHVVTNDEVIARRDFITNAASLLEAGAERVALHLRAPRGSGRLVFDLAEQLVEITRESGGCLLINDRLDVALAARAAGAQVGARGLLAEDARRVLGPNGLLGVSVHGVAEGKHAGSSGADFLLAGTLYSTPSHPGRPAAGTAWLEELVAVGVPVIGIGGIDRARVAEVQAAGAAGVAVIRAVWDAERPSQEALRFIEVLY